MCFADEEDSHTTACWELYTLEHGLSVSSSTSQCCITLVCLADRPVPCLHPSSPSPRTRLSFCLPILLLNKTRANPHLEITCTQPDGRIEAENGKNDDGYVSNHTLPCRKSCWRCVQSKSVVRRTDCLIRNVLRSLQAASRPSSRRLDPANTFLDPSMSSASLLFLLATRARARVDVYR